MIITPVCRGWAPRRRALVVATLACAFALVFAASAYAAPGVTNAKFSNPVAYELKSLLSTRFTCDVNTSGTWGKLDIMGANGIVKTVYSGPLTAGTNWFPLWNGMDASGKRLPSASYDWRLTVTKGGESTVVRGKITVSKIHFIVKGRLQDLGIAYYDRYMIPGNANIYFQATNESFVDSLYMYLWTPSDDLVGSGLISFEENETRKGTFYLRKNPGNDTSLHERGIHTFEVDVANDVTFYMTVIQ